MKLRQRYPFSAYHLWHQFLCLLVLFRRLCLFNGCCGSCSRILLAVGIWCGCFLLSFRFLQLILAFAILIMLLWAGLINLYADQLQCGQPQQGWFEATSCAWRNSRATFQSCILSGGNSFHHRSICFLTAFYADRCFYLGIGAILSETFRSCRIGRSGHLMQLVKQIAAFSAIPCITTYLQYCSRYCHHHYGYKFLSSMMHFRRSLDPKMRS